MVVLVLAGSCASATSSTSPQAGKPPSDSGSGGSSGYGHSGGYGNGGGGGGNGGDGGAPVATVTQADYAFSPSDLTVKAGDAITLTNGTTSTPHTFTIDGEGIDVTIAPQQSQDATIDLLPGTYTFYCTYHQSKGMTGTLTVT